MKYLKMGNKEFIDVLKAEGWNFEPLETKYPLTNRRLDKATPDLKEFVSSFGVLANEDDTVWFLSLKDYESKADDSEFAWNEFEKECLDSTEDDDDAREISEFWKNILPFLMNVDGQYSFIGMVVGKKNYGKIVYGCEPSYEEIEFVCDSFPEFIEMFARAVEGDLDDDSPLNEFV